MGALRIFAPYIDPDRATTFDADLSWYATLLGEVRDREVQRARFAAMIADLPPEQVSGPSPPDRGTLCGDQSAVTG